MPSGTHDPIARIRSALRADRRHAAARELLTAVARHGLRDDDELPALLRRGLGADGARKLLAALADLPCFHCKNGVQRCERCRGAGRDGRATVCHFCLGLGITSCEFCNGAGLTTYDLLPAALRVPALDFRAKLALRQADRLLKEPVHAAGSPQPSQGRKQLGGRLFGLDRVLGILENVVCGVREASRNRRTLRPFAARVLRACRRAAPKLDRRIRAILKQMEAAEQAGLANASSATARKESEQRVELFRSLQKRRGFRGTTLQHPFLKLGATLR